MDPRDFLQRLMAERQLNPNSLAAATHNKTKQPQIHRFLKGTAKEPKLSTWQPVAHFFGVPVGAFFDPKIADKAWAEHTSKAAGWTPAQHSAEGVSVRPVAHDLIHPQPEDEPTTCTWEFILSAVISTLPSRFRLAMPDDALAPSTPKGTLLIFETGTPPVFGHGVAGGGCGWPALRAQVHPGTWRSMVGRGEQRRLSHAGFSRRSAGAGGSDMAGNWRGVVLRSKPIMWAALLCALASTEAIAQTAWSNEPTSALGVKLGAPLAESSVSVCPTKRQMGAEVPRNCVGGWYEDTSNGALTFRDPPNLGIPYSASVTVYDGAVESVGLSVEAAHFDKMLALLVERYGQPSAKALVPMTTLGGARLSSRVWTWTGSAVSIHAVEMAGRVDQSGVKITHLETSARKQAKAQQATKDAAGRL